MKTVISLKKDAYLNIRRVLEIAKAGNYTIELLIEEGTNPPIDLIQDLLDFKSVKNGDIRIDVPELIFSQVEINIPNTAAKTLLKTAYEKLNLNLVDVNLIINIADTIRLLDEGKEIEASHIAEAIQYRMKND